MIENGKHDVTCLECGNISRIEKQGDTFTPANCPSCNSEIESITSATNGANLVINLK